MVISLKCNYKLRELFLFLFFFPIFFIRGQMGFYFYDENFYDNVLKIKTKKIQTVPSQPLQKNKLAIILPFVEYRFYGENKTPTHILDSSFASKLAMIDSNYSLFSNKSKLTQFSFSTKIFKTLSKYTDTVVISLKDDTSDIIKRYLKSIIEKANTTVIDEYELSQDAFNHLSGLHYDQICFTDILIYQRSIGHPNFFIKFTFFVFDLNTKKIFYYDNRYKAGQIFGKHLSQDLFQDYDLRKTLKSARFYKSMIRGYTKHLGKPVVEKKHY